MNLQTLEEQILRSKSADPNEFRRVCAEHACDIYVGWNEHRTLRIAGALCNISDFSLSTKIVEVKVGNTCDQTILTFKLTDENCARQFMQMCLDLYEGTEHCTKDNILKHVLKKWNCWRKMMKTPGSRILSEQEIKGLIGELLFLDRFMIPKYGAGRAVQSWVGCEKFRKDFEIGNTWYEIKAIKPDSDTIQISSLEQLDSADDGFLILMILEKTGQENHNGLNLNSIVASLMKTLAEEDDDRVLELFGDKLEKAGFIIDEYYDGFCFLHLGMETYIVNSDFPRLLRQNLPQSILKATYDISRRSIIKWNSCHD